MPSLFSNIFGQQTAITWLQQAYLADRLPHGLIFAGPVGVGKATTAAALAQLFLCEIPSDTKPCGKCESCRAFGANAHPDFHVITKELIRYHDKTGKSKGIDLSIHVLRPELIEPALRKPAMGRGKVFVVEQADLMNAQAQNALLKTLEEPYGRTLIILLTDQPGALLATIRSRCQLVRLASLDEQQVGQELVRRGIDRTIAGKAAALARGSLGLALKWIEDEVVEPAGQLADMIDKVLANEPPGDLPGWFRRAADAYAEKQLARDELASKDQATREGLTLYLTLASEHIRRGMSKITDADQLDWACRCIESLAQAESYLDGNVSIPLVFQELGAEMEVERK